MEKQKTIKEKCHFLGNGIHTGVFTNMTLCPAKENTGIIFIRTDLDNFKIEATINHVISTERSTSLGKNGVEVRTVEHILAAIAGNKIDNLIIEIDNIEIPILDGSARKFSKKIQEIGLSNQKNNKKYYQIKKKITYKDPKSKTEISII